MKSVIEHLYSIVDRFLYTCQVWCRLLRHFNFFYCNYSLLVLLELRKQSKLSAHFDTKQFMSREPPSKRSNNTEIFEPRVRKSLFILSRRYRNLQTTYHLVVKFIYPPLLILIVLNKF